MGECFGAGATNHRGTTAESSTELIQFSVLLCPQDSVSVLCVSVVQRKLFILALNSRNDNCIENIIYGATTA